MAGKWDRSIGHDWWLVTVFWEAIQSIGTDLFTKSMARSKSSVSVGIGVLLQLRWQEHTQ